MAVKVDVQPHGQPDVSLRLSYRIVLFEVSAIWRRRYFGFRHKIDGHHLGQIMDCDRSGKPFLF